MFNEFSGLPISCATPAASIVKALSLSDSIFSSSTWRSRVMSLTIMT